MFTLLEMKAPHLAHKSGTISGSVMQELKGSVRSRWFTREQRAVGMDYIFMV